MKAGALQTPQTVPTGFESLRNSLPHLLYLSDVPVENSYHGSAQLYRLLQEYPTDRLRIVETGPTTSRPDRRLAGVKYCHLMISNSRWLSTRFHRWVSSWTSLKASRASSHIASLLDSFQPESLLTVGHGYGWLMAAKYARTHHLPLHFVIHDDWPGVANLPGWSADWLERKFGNVYVQAKSRMCVSPYMAEEYRRRYGTDGSVIYPTRVPDSPQFNGPPERVGQNDHPFTVAFAGTINSQGYVNALSLMAQVLETVDGQLLIFGPLSLEAAKQAGLERSNIALRGLFDPRELLTRLRGEADALFVPMSFESKDRQNMELAFPSKLADYTALGLPLLVYGPDYSSAVRWAQDNPGCADLVTRESVELLAASVNRLAQEPERRTLLANNALKTGRAYFSHQVAQDVFYRNLGSLGPSLNSL